MATLRSQVIFPFFTSLPRDVITNTMHWITDDSNDPIVDAETIESRLTSFYNACYFAGGANYVVWNSARIKVYELEQPTPAPPVYDSPMDLTITPQVSNIPPEVAIVCSYHAAPVAGINPGRLRNRIYLGGWPSGAIDSSTASTFPRVHTNVLTDVADAAEALLGDNSVDVQWKIASRATGLIITHDIVGGHVNNEADTQRRRGVEESARTVWP